MGKKIIIRSVLGLLIGVILALFFFYGEEKPKGTALMLYGNVDIREVDLGFRVMGKVDKLYVDEGDRVKPGDLLATLDKGPYQDQVLRAQAELTSVQVSASNAKKQMDRRNRAEPSYAISEEEAENARASLLEIRAQVKASQASLALAETELSDTNLYCPSPGTVLTRIKEVGSVIAAGEPVFTVALQSPVWIRCYVAEPDLGYIFPGMEAEIVTDTKGSPRYKGHIGFISSVAEFTPKNVETTQLRTDLVYRLRVIVDNPDEGLRQGMPVTILLKKKGEKNS